jgi:hypothetical protein
MKSKHYIKLVIIVVVVFSLFSCTRRANFIEVNLSTEKTKTINFGKYEKIIFTDFILEAPPKNYDPQTEIREFFLEDFSGIISQDVEYISIPGKTLKEKSSNLKENLKTSANSLTITGRANFDIKSRSRIGEDTDPEGKKIKRFIKVEHWSLEIEIIITDLNSDKEIFKNTYQEKMSNVENTSPKYNFESLFFKINERFIREISRGKRIQKRYLLTK